MKRAVDAILKNEIVMGTGGSLTKFLHLKLGKNEKENSILVRVVSHI